MPWSEEERKAVLKALLEVYMYFQQNLDNRMLAVFADDIQGAGLTCAEALGAMRELRMEPGRRRGPYPNELVALVREQPSTREQATQLAGRVWTAITFHGRTNPDRARAYIGELAWGVLEGWGGWAGLCAETMSDGRSHFIAQLRDRIEGQMKINTIAQRQARLADASPRVLSPGTRQGHLKG